MNSKQTAAATLLGTVAADTLIGGIGIGMLGGAVGIPAAAVVAAVGGTITVAKYLGERADSPNTYVLNKGDVSIEFTIDKDRKTGSYQYKTEHASQPKTTLAIAELRKAYSNFIKSGYALAS
jgi:hypothetical protein